MKIKLLFALILMNFTLKSQESKSLFSIKGKFDNCNKGVLSNCYPFIVFKKDGKIIKDSFYFQTDTSDHFFLNFLEEGNYSIEYYNFFNQKFEKKIELVQSIDNLILCEDVFVKDDKSNIIENLGEKDTLIINYEMMGCFDQQDYKKIFFIKERNKIIAKLYYSKYQDNPNKSTKYYLKRKKTLNQKDIENVVSIEQLSRFWINADRGCTLSEGYQLIYKNKELYSFHDNSCCFVIFRHLEYYLFEIKK